jgi:hypothetical protein
LFNQYENNKLGTGIQFSLPAMLEISLGYEFVNFGARGLLLAGAQTIGTGLSNS